MKSIDVEKSSWNATWLTTSSRRSWNDGICLANWAFSTTTWYRESKSTFLPYNCVAGSFVVGILLIDARIFDGSSIILQPCRSRRRWRWCRHELCFSFWIIHYLSILLFLISQYHHHFSWTNLAAPRASALYHRCAKRKAAAQASCQVKTSAQQMKCRFIHCSCYRQPSPQRRPQPRPESHRQLQSRVEQMELLCDLSVRFTRDHRCQRRVQRQPQIIIMW